MKPSLHLVRRPHNKRSDRGRWAWILVGGAIIVSTSSADVTKRDQISPHLQKIPEQYLPLFPIAKDLESNPREYRQVLSGDGGYLRLCDRDEIECTEISLLKSKSAKDILLLLSTGASVQYLHLLSIARGYADITQSLISLPNREQTIALYQRVLGSRVSPQQISRSAHGAIRLVLKDNGLRIVATVGLPIDQLEGMVLSEYEFDGDRFRAKSKKIK